MAQDKPWERYSSPRPIVAPPPPSPAEQYEAPQAAANVENTQSTIEERRAAAARAARELALKEEEAQRKAREAAREEQEAAESAATEQRQLVARKQEVQYALRQLQEARKLVGGNSTGTASEYLRGIPFLGQDKADLDRILETPFAQIMQIKMAELAQANDGGVSKLGDTPAEVQRMAAAVANLSTEQRADQLLEQINRAEQYFLDIAAKYEGSETVTPEIAAEYLPKDRAQQILPESDGQGGLKFSPSASNATQSATGETYSTPEDLAVRDEMQSIYNAGGSLADMVEVSRRYNRPVTLQTMQEWARAIDYRDGKGEYAGQNTGFVTIPPPESGRRSLLGQMYGDFARSDIGSSAVGLGVGAANAATFGGIDEITGGVNALLTGQDVGASIDYANRGKQAAADAAPGSYFLGELTGGVTLGGAVARGIPRAAQVLAGSGRRAAATGAAVGSVTGALEANDDRLGGALLGGTVGGLGGLAAEKVLAPAIEGVIASRPGQRVENSFRRAMNVLRPGSVSSQGLQEIDPDFIRLSRSLDDPAAVSSRISEAREMGIPYALADASPKLRSLGGSVSRLSQDARQMAEETFDPRGLDQATRARSAVGQYLAPILDDPEKRARELGEAGRIAAQPLYNISNSKPAPISAELSAYLNTQTGKDALKAARRIAENEGRDPTELGFILDEGGGVSLPGMDGRFTKAPVGNPDDMLTRGSVRGMNGDVPVKGPVDLVGWLRLSGGLRDSGGELRSMGLTNKARSGDDLIGQEGRFGPLVSDQGMNLDDAALAAWEQGYFPEMSARPSVNEFLDALRDTYDGVNRRFTADDLPEVERYRSAVQQRDIVREARWNEAPLYEDNSVPAGPRPFAPPEAYGREVPVPTMETLDYVKRGIDEQIYSPSNVNPNTGRLLSPLPPSVRSLEVFRKNFVNELDRLNPDYPQARAAYQPFAQAREALNRGRSAVTNRAQSREVQEAIRGMPDLSLEQYRAGFATGLGDLIDNQSLSGDPFKRIYGSTTARQKVDTLFPEGSERFARFADFEKDMAATRQETLGGSPTAQRQAADEQFTNRAFEIAANGAADVTATGGALTSGTFARMGANAIRDYSRLGFGRQAEARANRLAPILFDTAGDIDYLDALQNYMAQRSARKQTAKRYGGLFGASIAPSLFVTSE